METSVAGSVQVHFDWVELSGDAELILGSSVSTASVTRAHADHNDRKRAAMAARRQEAERASSAARDDIAWVDDLARACADEAAAAAAAAVRVSGNQRPVPRRRGDWWEH